MLAAGDSAQGRRFGGTRDRRCHDHVLRISLWQHARAPGARERATCRASGTLTVQHRRSARSVVICCLVRDPVVDRARLARSRPSRARVRRASSSRRGRRRVRRDGLARVIGPPDDIAREVHAAGRAAADRRRASRSRATMTAAWLLAHARPGARSWRRTTRSSRPAAARWLATLPDVDCAALAQGSWLRAGRLTGEEAALGDAVRRRGHYRLAPGRGTSRPRIGNRSRPRRSMCWRRSSAGGCARSAMSRGLPRADCTRGWGRGVRLHQAARGEDISAARAGRRRAAFVERSSSSGRSKGSSRCRSCWPGSATRCPLALERADRGAVDGHDAGCGWSHARCTSACSICRRRCATRACCARSSCSISNRIRRLPAIDVVEIELERHAGSHRAGLAPRAHAAVAGEIWRRSSRGWARSWANRASARPRWSTRHDERPSAMTPFPRRPASGTCGPPVPATCQALNRQRSASPLRRFRLPVAARVTVERGAPVHVVPSARGAAGGRGRSAPVPGARRAAGGRSIAPTGIATSGTWSWPAATVYRLARDRARTTGRSKA